MRIKNHLVRRIFRESRAAVEAAQWIKVNFQLILFFYCSILVVEKLGLFFFIRNYYQCMLNPQARHVFHSSILYQRVQKHRERVAWVQKSFMSLTMAEASLVQQAKKLTTTSARRKVIKSGWRWLRIHLKSSFCSNVEFRWERGKQVNENQTICSLQLCLFAYCRLIFSLVQHINVHDRERLRKIRWINLHQLFNPTLDT